MTEVTPMGAYTAEQAHADDRHKNGSLADKEHWAKTCTQCATPHCTCGASYYRGCFCNLTISEFMKSKYAKGI